MDIESKAKRSMTVFPAELPGTLDGKGWATPGGGVVYGVKNAKEYAKRMARIMKGGRG